MTKTQILEAVSEILNKADRCPPTDPLEYAVNHEYRHAETLTKRANRRFNSRAISFIGGNFVMVTLGMMSGYLATGSRLGLFVGGVAGAIPPTAFAVHFERAAQQKLIERDNADNRWGRFLTQFANPTPTHADYQENLQAIRDFRNETRRNIYFNFITSRLPSFRRRASAQALTPQ